MIDLMPLPPHFTGWRTPPEFFLGIQTHNIEWHFTFDAAADDDNALCRGYFTEQQDALEQDWPLDEWIWCNPPYGRKLGMWVRKMAEQTQRGCKIVGLVPASTDTQWNYRSVLPNASRVIHLVGRIPFDVPPGYVQKSHNRYTNMLVEFAPRTRWPYTQLYIEYWDWRKDIKIPDRRAA